MRLKILNFRVLLCPTLKFSRTRPRLSPFSARIILPSCTSCNPAQQDQARQGQKCSNYSVHMATLSLLGWYPRIAHANSNSEQTLRSTVTGGVTMLRYGSAAEVVRIVDDIKRDRQCFC